MEVFLQMINNIIREQELVIGPIAWEEADKVASISVDANTQEVSISGDNKSAAVNELVKQYSRLFGDASVEVCKDAVRDLMTEVDGDNIPELLR